MTALSAALRARLVRHGPAPTSGWPLAVALVAIAVAIALGTPETPGWLLTHGWPVAQVLFGVALGCLAPGAALVRWLWPTLRASAVEHLALAAGAGIALAPLVTGLASLGGLGLARPAWWIVGVASTAWLAWGWWRAPRRRPAWPDITGATLLATLLLVLFARIFAVRDQFVATYDGYHHTMIAQLLVDHGGLFQDWAPYAPLGTFTYHFGFHALVAATHWLGGAPVPLATLYVGQLMLFGTVLAAAALASRLTGVPGAALWAAVLVGLINLQPAYYAFWGRYTYPAGQIALVTCLLVWLAALEAPEPRWRLLLLGGVVAGGMALTHYQVAIIAGFFVVALLLQRLGVAARRALIRPWLTRVAAMGSIALLLVLPWAIVALQGALLGHSLYNAAGGERAVRADPGDISAQVIVATLPAIVPFSLKAPLLALALLGALLAAVVLANVVALNWCYDVPVKLYATHLLVAALALLLPWRGALWALFVANRSCEPPDLAVVRAGWLRATLTVAGALLVVAHLLTLHVEHAAFAAEQATKNGPKPALHGVWEVEAMKVERPSADPAGVPAFGEVPLTDATRWRRLVVGRGGVAYAEDFAGTRVEFTYAEDLAADNVTLRPKSGDGDGAWAANVGGATRQVLHPAPTTKDDFTRRIDQPRTLLTLRGTFAGKRVELQLVKRVFDLQRGFHFRQELPYHR